MMTTKICGKWAAAGGAAMLLGACYQGVGDADGSLSGGTVDDGAGDGSAADGGSGGAGDEQSGPASASCEQRDVGATPLRRLTRTQYDHTLRDLLGVELGLAEQFVADEKLGAFDSNAVAGVTSLSVEQYMDAAEVAATEAVTDISAILPCDPAQIGDDACADQFIDTFGPRAFRRPMSEAQRTDARALYDHGAEAGGFSDGIRLVVQGMLQSPFFLYHVEDVPSGTEGQVRSLSSYEVASRMSYFLWGSMPDEELFAAAEADALLSEEQLRAQAERMLADPRAKDSIHDFHRQWLELEGLEQLDKDEELFPAFSPGLARAMEREVDRYVEDVILEGDGTVKTLLTASFTYVNEELAALYGVEDPGGEGLSRVELPPDERSGLLTLAGVMARHSHHNQTSPVLRGAMVRQNMLCTVPPPPPDNVNDEPPGLDPTLPTKERFEQHREDPACAGCHQLLDPLGYGFEHFDALGQYRTMDGEHEVDASGEFIAAGDANGPYDGHRELSERLASSEEALTCISRQWFLFALGRYDVAADRCTVDQIFSRFAESGHNIRDLMIEIAVSDAVRYTKASPEQE